MAVRVNNINLSLEEDVSVLKERAAKRLNLPKTALLDLRISRESIDARKKDNIRFNYSVLVKCENESKVVDKARDKDVVLEAETEEKSFIYGQQKMKYRPIVVGMGPAGIFAGLLLARNGYKPIIIERGQAVEDRTHSVEEFWRNGKLNLESNVQFGEGGAGTFSDGKLTTRIKDPKCDLILQELVKAGAPPETVYMGKPHIGTDILKTVVKNIRKHIIDLGGEVRFDNRLECLISKNKRLSAVKVNGEEIPCDVLVLAIGHSSRDTYEMLYKSEVVLTPKAFAMGVRIEHPQELIDISQYGKYAGHPRLKAADYRLAHTNDVLNRAVYSFCMCPGGEVVAAASEGERLVTNGMSYYKRDGVNANSALVVSVKPEDFDNNNALSGMEFQRRYESLAYKLGGGGYEAPVQLVGDFLKNSVSNKIGKVEPTYRPGYNFRDLRQCLPGFIIDMLKEGINIFDKKIHGFAMNDAVLTGVETRTSAPVRIERNENLQSLSLKGLYPAGEGAGYAGGIVSAAVDGLKVAEGIMKDFAPLD